MDLLLYLKIPWKYIKSRLSHIRDKRFKIYVSISKFHIHEQTFHKNAQY